MKEQNMSNGVTESDFSKKEDRTRFFDRFGGEDFILKNYPAVHKAILDTPARKVKRKDASADFVEGDEGIAEHFTVQAPGLTNSFNSDMVSNLSSKTNHKSFYLVSDMFLKFEHSHPFTFLVGTLENENGRLLSSIASDSDDTVDMTARVQTPFQDLMYEDDMGYVSCGEYVSIDSDGCFSAVRSTRSAETIVHGKTSIVKNFIITDPIYNHQKQSGDIIMLYARDPTSEETNTWDYKEPNNAPKNDLVDTLLPLSGSIEVTDTYTIEGYSDGGFEIGLFYKGESKPWVTYNHSIKQYFTVSSDKKMITFDLDKDWNCSLDTKRYTDGPSAIVLLSASFSIYVRLVATGKLVPIPVAMMINSTSDTNITLFESEGTTVYIPCISIRWGCFGRNTMIRMANGEEKMICNIVSGEQIKGIDGEILNIVNVLTGHEDVMIRIETIEGNDILLTASHPISTTRGVLKASDVRPNDTMMMESGIPEIVKFAHLCEYNDTVYSLVLNMEKSLLFANGFVAGDYGLQNNMPLQKSEPLVYTPEVNELVTQFKQLIRERGLID